MFKIRTFLRRWYGSVRNLHTEILTIEKYSPTKKVLIGLPGAIVGSCLLYYFSHQIANTTLKWRRRKITPPRRLPLGDTLRSSCVQELPFHTLKKSGTNDIEDFLMLTFTNNASTVSHGESYMTASDFLALITGESHEAKIKHVNNTAIRDMANGIPRRWKTSTHFLRDLGEVGLLDLSDFVLLMHMLTNPPEFFKPIFKVLVSGKGLISARDFEYVKAAMSPCWQRECDAGTAKQNMHAFDGANRNSSCLTTHLFGPKLDDVIRFVDLKRFVQNIHQEVLELEFTRLAGRKGHLDLAEFAVWLFRFTNVREQDKDEPIRKDSLEERHNASDIVISLEDLRVIHDIVMFHLSYVSDALTLSSASSPGLTSHHGLAQVLHIASGVVVNPSLSRALFLIFSDNREKVFDHERFCETLRYRKTLGLPLKVEYQLGFPREDEVKI